MWGGNSRVDAVIGSHVHQVEPKTCRDVSGAGQLVRYVGIDADEAGVTVRLPMRVHDDLGSPRRRSVETSKGRSLWIERRTGRLSVPTITRRTRVCFSTSLWKVPTKGVNVSFGKSGRACVAKVMALGAPTSWSVK